VQVSFQLKQLKYAFYSGTRLKALFVELGESVVHLYWCRDEYVYFVKLKKKMYHLFRSTTIFHIQCYIGTEQTF